jgi:hypothetical protein
VLRVTLLFHSFKSNNLQKTYILNKQLNAKLRFLNHTKEGRKHKTFLRGHDIILK